MTGWAVETHGRASLQWPCVSTLSGKKRQQHYIKIQAVRFFQKQRNRLFSEIKADAKAPAFIVNYNLPVKAAYFT
jgi:hypothetical protein